MATKSPTSGAPSGGIPVVRRVRVTSGSQIPRDFSQTPGGTIFSTTPGGTRIIYDREFLISRRDSPLAKTPPADLPHIPGVTCPIDQLAGRDGAGDGSRRSSGDASGNGGTPAAKGDSSGNGTEFHIDV